MVSCQLVGGRRLLQSSATCAREVDDRSRGESRKGDGEGNGKNKSRRICLELLFCFKRLLGLSVDATVQILDIYGNFMGADTVPLFWSLFLADTHYLDIYRQLEGLFFD